ncbi:25-hydroxyvitamin D-1 alpha hydroxylase, mitochondrial isoform 1-T1 [Sylvia borin]
MAAEEEEAPVPPQKRFYRQRAHSNPLADHTLHYGAGGALPADAVAGAGAAGEGGRVHPSADPGAAGGSARPLRQRGLRQRQRHETPAALLPPRPTHEAQVEDHQPCHAGGVRLRAAPRAISWVLFSSRLGCLGDTGEDTTATDGVIQCVGAVLALTLVTMALPRPLLRLVPAPWDAFCRAWDQLFSFAKGHVDRRVAEVAARGPLAEGDTCVTDLLAREHIPVSSIYGNITELLLAGVDTVASTLAWSLYELARNPGAQAALHRELVAATATNRATNGDSATTDSATAAATAAALGRLPLLRAVVKETLRLYPVIPANARVVSDHDIRVGDYLVPRQTLITLCHYATSRDSRFFSAPDAFRPERWLRHRDTGDTPGDTAGDAAGHPPGPRHPFASLPFGLGPRSCVGRRLAELQLHMALAQILLRFEVRPEPGGGRVRPMTRTLLAPATPISLRFLER